MDYTQATDEVAQIEQKLQHRLKYAKVQGKVPDTAVMHIVHDMLSDPVNLERGQILTPIMRIDLAWRNTLLEYVTLARPYEGTRLSIYATLRNDGGASYTINRAVKQLIRRSSSGAVTDAWETMPIKAVVSPGAEIELSAHFAILAMNRHDWKCKPPVVWDRIEKGNRTLHEVAYRAEWIDPETGEIHSVNSRDYAPRTQSEPKPKRRGRPKKVTHDADSQS